MTSVTEDELVAIRSQLRKLTNAIERERSMKWQLRLWSRFIKTRDAFRCLCCGEKERIQAHHIMRRTLYPLGSVALGNGITMCRPCHHRVHAQFNGKPDLSQPLGAEQGDDQDEWAFLFGLLVEDAATRALPESEFYPVGDSIMRFSVRVQGYRQLYEQVQRGQLSKIRFAHEIWRAMPEQFYKNLFSTVLGA